MNSQRRNNSPHIFAGLGTIIVVTILPLFLYFVLMVVTNDVGGPLNLVLIPCSNLISAILFTLIVFFPLSILLERVSQKVSRNRVNRINPVLFSGVILVLMLALVVGVFILAASSILVNHITILIFDVIFGERDVNSVTVWLFRFLYLGGVPFFLGSATYWFLLQVSRAVMSHGEQRQELSAYPKAG